MDATVPGPYPRVQRRAALPCTPWPPGCPAQAGPAPSSACAEGRLPRIARGRSAVPAHDEGPALQNRLTPDDPVDLLKSIDQVRIHDDKAQDEGHGDTVHLD